MGNWIKIRSELKDSPKIGRLAKLLKAKRPFAFGLAVLWLDWMDGQTDDGVVDLTAEELDEQLGVKGAANALEQIGWIYFEDGMLVMSEYEKHNGPRAKERAETARRVAEFKRRKRAKLECEKVTEKCYPVNEKNVTEVTVPRAHAGGNLKVPSPLPPRGRACAATPLGEGVTAREVPTRGCMDEDAETDREIYSRLLDAANLQEGEQA